jgi:hypothetical protein
MRYLPYLNFRLPVHLLPVSESIILETLVIRLAVSLPDNKLLRGRLLPYFALH